MLKFEFDSCHPPLPRNILPKTGRTWSNVDPEFNWGDPSFHILLYISPCLLCLQAATVSSLPETSSVHKAFSWRSSIQSLGTCFSLQVKLTCDGLSWVPGSGWEPHSLLCCYYANIDYTGWVDCGPVKKKPHNRYFSQECWSKREHCTQRWQL